MTLPAFNTPVQNPNEPQGRVATELRRIVTESPINTLGALKTSANYEVNTLSEAMRGNSRQGVKIIVAIVNACIEDRTTAERKIVELKALRDHTDPAVPPTNETPATEKPVEDGPGGHDPGGSPPGHRGWGTRWRRSPKLLALAAVVALMVITSAGYGVYRLTAAASCGDGVARVGVECIGVTDGSNALAPGFADVLDRIHTENQRVLNSGRPWVSIAYLMPIGIDGEASALPNPALRHELEGAFIGQLEANQAESSGLDARPQLRLLVANDGDGAGQWHSVVPTLAAMTDPAAGFATDKLVAVVATGKSTTATQEAITALTNRAVPVIVSRLTGDQVLDAVSNTNSNPPLARIAPTNTDQVNAMITYLHTAPTLPNGQPVLTTRALLVQNSDPNDAYAASLGNAFTTIYPKVFADPAHTLLVPSETYNPGATAGDMAYVLGNVCAHHANLVFFAGRSAELTSFIQALPNRTCANEPLTVIAGADAVDFATLVATGPTNPADPAALQTTLLRRGLTANVTFLYTAIASSGAWTPPTPGAATPVGVTPGSIPPGAPVLLQDDPRCPQQCFTHQFPGPTDTLDDGGAIMGHDAVLTAATAIGGNGINITPARIAQRFNQLHGTSPVPLASGWLSLTKGKATNKAVPILQVLPDGTRFLALTGPLGIPCIPQLNTC